MTSRPENQYHGSAGNTVSLKEYFDARIDSLETATSLVAENMKAKFESVNEWRGQSKDREEMFLTRTEFEAQMKSVIADIRILRDSKNVLEGKASQQAVNTAFIFAAVGTVVAVISLVISLVNLVAK